MESLTEKVLAFQKSGRGLEDLVTAIASRIYRYPQRTLGWDEDSCGDFYVFFQPRLRRMISRFRDQGKPFESYLCSVLAWQLKNFCRERRRTESRWQAALRLEYGERENDTAEAGAWPEPEEAGRLDVIQSNADRRNLLLLSLKCARALTPERIRVLSPLIGLPEEAVEGLVERLLVRARPRERRLECFRTRRNRAFTQARLVEEDMAREPDPVRKEALRARLGVLQRRMAVTMLRMSRIMLAPTNREIALLLGLPKGTVDSGLFWFKRKLASAGDPDRLESA